MSGFNEHNPDEQFILKRDHEEVTSWIDHLEEIVLDLGRLKKLIKKSPEQTISHAEICDYESLMKTKISKLYNYRHSLDNILECQDIDCDVYYKERHNTIREDHLKTINDYDSLKKTITKIFVVQG